MDEPDLSSVFGLLLGDQLVGLDPATGNLHELPWSYSESEGGVNLGQWRFLSVAGSRENRVVWDSGTGVSTPVPAGVGGSAVTWLEDDLFVIESEVIDDDGERWSRVLAHRVRVDGSLVWSVDLNPQRDLVYPWRLAGSGDQALVGLWYEEGGTLPAASVLVDADGSVAWRSDEAGVVAAGLGPGGLVVLDRQVLTLPDGSEIAVPGGFDMIAVVQGFVLVSDEEGRLLVVAVDDGSVRTVGLPDGCFLRPLRSVFVGDDPSPMEMLVELVESAGYETGPGMREAYPTVEVIGESGFVTAESFPLLHEPAPVVGQVMLSCEHLGVRVRLTPGLDVPDAAGEVAQRITDAGLDCRLG